VIPVPLHDWWKDVVIIYDPEDEDTYPSICPTPEDVKRRFGWTGGEKFTHRRLEEWFDGIDRDKPITQS
jgi:hypothetical protein